MKLRARESLSYLTDFLQAVQSSGATPVYWESPRVGVDLPVLVGDEVHLEPPKEEEGERTPFGQHLCEVRVFLERMGEGWVAREGRGGEWLGRGGEGGGLGGEEGEGGLLGWILCEVMMCVEGWGWV